MSYYKRSLSDNKNTGMMIAWMFNDELVLGEKEGGDCNFEGRVRVSNPLFEVQDGAVA
jgi:hypothetical protein